MNGWLIAYNWGHGLEFWDYVSGGWSLYKSPNCAYSSKSSAKRGLKRMHNRALDEGAMCTFPIEVVRWEDVEEPCS